MNDAQAEINSTMSQNIDDSILDISAKELEDELNALLLTDTKPEEQVQDSDRASANTSISAEIGKCIISTKYHMQNSHTVLAWNLT